MNHFHSPLNHNISHSHPLSLPPLPSASTPNHSHPLHPTHSNSHPSPLPLPHAPAPTGTVIHPSPPSPASPHFEKPINPISPTSTPPLPRPPLASASSTPQYRLHPFTHVPSPLYPNLHTSSTPLPPSAPSPHRPPTSTSFTPPNTNPTTPAPAPASAPTPPYDVAKLLAAGCTLIHGRAYSAKGHHICGVLNQHDQPCKRIGKCPFHLTTNLSTSANPHPHRRRNSSSSSSSSSSTTRVAGKRVPMKLQYKHGWSKEEHYKFLKGLQLFDRGNWKRISTYVGTRSPMQVQSHAQKYFLRRSQPATQKKKCSIHDFELTSPEMKQVELYVERRRRNGGTLNGGLGELDVGLGLGIQYVPVQAMHVGQDGSNGNRVNSLPEGQDDDDEEEDDCNNSGFGNEASRGVNDAHPQHRYRGADGPKLGDGDTGFQHLRETNAAPIGEQQQAQTQTGCQQNQFQPRAEDVSDSDSDSYSHTNANAAAVHGSRPSDADHGKDQEWHFTVSKSHIQPQTNPQTQLQVLPPHPSQGQYSQEHHHRENRSAFQSHAHSGMQSVAPGHGMNGLGQNAAYSPSCTPPPPPAPSIQDGGGVRNLNGSGSGYDGGYIRNGNDCGGGFIRTGPGPAHVPVPKSNMPPLPAPLPHPLSMPMSVPFPVSQAAGCGPGHPYDTPLQAVYQRNYNNPTTNNNIEANHNDKCLSNRTLLIRPQQQQPTTLMQPPLQGGDYPPRRIGKQHHHSFSNENCYHLQRRELRQQVSTTQTSSQHQVPVSIPQAQDALHPVGHQHSGHFRDGDAEREDAHGWTTGHVRHDFSPAGGGGGVGKHPRERSEAQPQPDEMRWNSYATKRMRVAQLPQRSESGQVYTSPDQPQRTPHTMPTH